MTTPSGPNERVGLKLSAAQRDLILGLILMDDELAERIRKPPTGQGDVPLTLDELSRLVTYVEADASHTPDERRRKQLHRLCRRIDRLMTALEET